ncbi:hypothetical protein FKW77_005724 [Venturia effusa]|uniref:Uncharacterized protein n=1 Tax=Venturia effusa TaxID=50376 RepID=A0A517LDR4_9PEZI|nr:hypothetical protein FKW77_005724 [Venturia effusa]
MALRTINTAMTVLKVLLATELGHQIASFFHTTSTTLSATMSSEKKASTTQPRDSPASASQTTASRPLFHHAKIRSALDFRTAFIRYLKGDSDTFRPVKEEERHVLKQKYGDDMTNHTSKIVLCGNDKYAWLFKVTEMVRGLKIKNVRLITDSGVSEEDYVFLDCEASAIARAKFWAGVRRDERKVAAAGHDAHAEFLDARDKVVLVQSLWRGRRQQRAFRDSLNKIVMIQSLWRCRTASKEYKVLRLNS